MITNGYKTIDDVTYYYDYETMYMCNNVTQLCEFYHYNEYGEIIKKLYDYAVQNGLNDHYCITLNDITGDDDIIICIFDKNNCYTYMGQNFDNDCYNIECIDNFDKWINNEYNQYNAIIIDILLSCNV